MASRHTFTSGFTLIEMVLVVALLACCATLALSISATTYRQDLQRDEYQVVLSTLWRARTRALAQECTGTCRSGTPVGVYFGEPRAYVLFLGASYASRVAERDERIERGERTVVSGCHEIVFAPRAGNATCTGGTELVLTDPEGRTHPIRIESSGRITTPP